MSEKVLGFKEKDAVTFTAEDQKEPTYSIWEKQLVPVVSLQALEKMCKDLNNDETYCEINQTIECWHCKSKRLLSWAKKEAKKNG